MRAKGRDARGLSACGGCATGVDVEGRLWRRFVAHAAANCRYGGIEMGMRAKVMERACGGASARNTKTRGRSVRLGVAMMGGMMVMVMGGMGLL